MDPNLPPEPKPAPPTSGGGAPASGPVPIEAKRRARSLYWRGWGITQIAEELDLRVSTVASWKSRHRWDAAPSAIRIEDGIEERYLTLIGKTAKTGGDYKEIDLLGRQIERMARVRKYDQTGREADLNPNVAKRNSPEVQEKRAAKRNEKGKNFLTEEQWEDLETDFHDWCFRHQRRWWEQRKQRNRKLLKSRQIGATAYFSREGLMKAKESSDAGEPRNQIFLSASKRQALIFKRNLVSWVRKKTGVELKGDPIVLDMGEGRDAISLFFLSTNAATAQSESGDLYFDEFFWVHGFAELKKVASGMATHKIYKRTYFSTPSTITHEAYPFWSGGEWNKGRARIDQREFNVSKRALAAGAMMPDGAWQQTVTVHDAIAGGMQDLLDVDELKQENSADEFSNLYECEFIDDTESSFPFALLSPCRTDSFYTWKDYRQFDARPFGNGRVSIGYDPDKGGRDGAALAVVALPDRPGGKFRLLEKISLKGKDYEQQNDAIRKISRRFNVVDIAIDTSGAGDAVLNHVLKWFPTARRIDYNISTKAQLVLKGQNVIRKGRFEYDAGWADVSAAFMAIRPTIVGKTVTYTARRSGVHGHADIAWAVLHAFSNEPMDASEAGMGQATVEFSE